VADWSLCAGRGLFVRRSTSGGSGGADERHDGGLRIWGAPTTGQDAQGTLVRLTTGYRLSEMLHVAAKLGIADLLAVGPKGCGELARLCGVHAPSPR
jgi:hypothetical protein